MPHIHELIDFTISAVIVHPDKKQVLLVEHPRYQKWLTVGGHVELEDDTDTTLLKEISEESGLEVEVLSKRHDFKNSNSKALWTPDFMDIHDANPPHKHIALVYITLAKSANFTKSDEHTSLKWFTEPELYDPQYKLDESVIFYNKEALKRVQNQ